MIDLIEGNDDDIDNNHTQGPINDGVIEVEEATQQQNQTCEQISSQKTNWKLQHNHVIELDERKHKRRRFARTEATTIDLTDD